MVEDNRPAGDGGLPGEPPAGPRYYGPFAPQPPGDASTEDTRPLGIGSWHTEESAPRPQPTQAVPPVDRPVGPSFTYPAPPGVQPLQPRPLDFPPPRPQTSRAGRGLALVLAAALVALVVGAAAGFGGARLAERTSAAPAPTAPPATTAQRSAPPTTPAPGPSSTPVPPAPGQMNTVAVAKAVLPSTVVIRVGGSGSQSIGSGFVLDGNGHVMTNNHVVAGAADGGRITVAFSDGRRSSATIVGRSPSYDLAVIKLARSSGLKALPIGDSAAAQVGSPVIAVGAPLGLPGTVTQGIVSAKDRPVVVSGGESADAPTAYINGIQTDAPINPGNSGGPLIDAGGRVIGVNSAILTLGQTQQQAGNIGLGFAIPIQQAVQIASLLIRDGKATYPVIGANVEDASNGVELTSVEPDGPADDAGLRVGDIVRTVDGRRVTTLEELIVDIRTHRPGQVVTFAYERRGADRSAKVTLGSREG